MEPDGERVAQVVPPIVAKATPLAAELTKMLLFPMPLPVLVVVSVRWWEA